MKSASEIHSLSEASVSALPCSDWDSLLELELEIVDRTESI